MCPIYPWKPIEFHIEASILVKVSPKVAVKPPEARHCDGHRAATAGGTATRQRQRGATKRRVGEGLPGGSTYEVEKNRYLRGVLCFLRYIMCMIV